MQQVLRLEMPIIRLGACPTGVLSILELIRVGCGRLHTRDARARLQVHQIRQRIVTKRSTFVLRDQQHIFLVL